MRADGSDFRVLGPNCVTNVSLARGRAVYGVNILIPAMHRGRLSATVCMHLSCEQGAIGCSKERGVKWHR
jgi:hypothetical protein